MEHFPSESREFFRHKLSLPSNFKLVNSIEICISIQNLMLQSRGGVHQLLFYLIIKVEHYIKTVFQQKYCNSTLSIGEL